MLEFRLQLSSSSPPPLSWKLHKPVLVSIHEFPPLFVMLVPEATYLYTSLRIVITNHQNYHSRNDRFLSRKISSSFHDALVWSSTTKVLLSFSPHLLRTPTVFYSSNKNDDTCDHFPRCSTYLKNISTEYKTFRYWVHSLESFVIQSKGDRSSFVRLWRNTDLYPESIYTKGVERSKSLNPRKGGKRLCGAFDCWAEWNGGEIRYYPVGKVIYGVVRISSAIVEIETIHKAR